MTAADLTGLGRSILYVLAVAWGAGLLVHLLIAPRNN